MNKQKMQLEDEKLKNKANSTRIDTLEGELKLAEEKLGHNRYNLNTYKKTLSEKELEIKNIEYDHQLQLVMFWQQHRL